MNGHFDEDNQRHNDETEATMMARKFPGCVETWLHDNRLIKTISRAERAKKEGELYLNPSTYEKFLNSKTPVVIYVIDIDKEYDFSKLKWMKCKRDGRLVMVCRTYLPELVNNAG